MSQTRSGLRVGYVDGETQLVVSRESCVLRHDLGPVAWSVLEALVLKAQFDVDGQLVARVGVRQLAEAVGVGKDTAARAFLELRGRELVSIEEQRAGDGRFCGTRYTVHLTVSLKADTVRVSRRSKRRMGAPTLFDAPPQEQLRTSTSTPTEQSKLDPSHSTVLDHAEHRTSSGAATPFPKSRHEFALGMPNGPAGAGC